MSYNTDVHVLLRGRDYKNILFILSPVYNSKCFKDFLAVSFCRTAEGTAEKKMTKLLKSSVWGNPKPYYLEKYS